MSSGPWSSLQANPLRTLAGAIKQEWKARRQAPDACAAFDLHPELLEAKTFVLDLAYEEFCQRRQRGEIVDPQEFSARFPRHQRAILALVESHGYLWDHPELLPDELPDPWPSAGEDVAGFTIRRELGRGAFSRVYLATETTAGDRPVALKLTFEGGAEANILGRLPHPNIVHVNSAGEDEELGLTRLCMPFLGAATLFTLFRRAFPEPNAAPPARASLILEVIATAGQPDDPPPHVEASTTFPPEVLRSGTYSQGVAELGRQLADALASVHRGGVFHRDLKPSNVLLAPGGRAVLLDFNLSNDGRAAAARLGGTLPYMAPEHIRVALEGNSGSSEIDGRADLFSLGVILYELLTGRPPFGPLPPPKARTEEGGPIMLAAQRRGFVPVRRLNPDTQALLARVVERCLALRPEDRPADAAEVARALRDYLARARPSPRRRWYSVASGAALLTLGVLAAAKGWPRQAPLTARDPVPVAAVSAVNLASPEGLFQEARQNLLAEKDATAILFFQEAEKLREKEQQRADGLTLACMSFCMARSAQYHAAVEFAARARAAGFSSGAVFNNEGVAFYRMHQLDKARDAFTEAIQLTPGLREPLLNRATLTMTAPIHPERFPQARADLQAALNLGDPNGEVSYKAALLELCVPDYDAALLHFQEAARRHLPRGFFRAQLGIHPNLETRADFCQLLLDAPEMPLVPMSSVLIDPGTSLDR